MSLPDLSALRALSERATTGNMFAKMEWLSACERVGHSMLSEEGLERAPRALVDHAYTQKGLVKASDVEWSEMRQGCVEGISTALASLVGGL